MNAYKNLAETYESVRPGYPDELIADIIKAGNLSPVSKLMEIGAGTGKATTAFLNRGFAVDANEIEPDMAEVLRRKETSDKLNLSVGPFETWVPPHTEYDCIYCGQAFHWLDKEIKFKKCKEYLSREGLLALFWYDPMPHVQTAANFAAEQVKEKYLGAENIVTSVSMDTRLQEITETPYFDLLEKKTYQVVLKNTADQSWAAMESTPAFQKKYADLSNAERTKFRKEYTTVIEYNGGFTETSMLYTLYLLRPKYK